MEEEMQRYGKTLEGVEELKIRVNPKEGQA